MAKIRDGFQVGIDDGNVVLTIIADGKELGCSYWTIDQVDELIKSLQDARSKIIQ